MISGEENKYVSAVSKRLRNLSKKLSKIQELQTKVDGGAELQPEQLQTLAAKGVTEASVRELEALKASLEEISKGGQEASASSKQKEPPAVTVLSEEEVLAMAESIAIDASKLSLEVNKKITGEKIGSDVPDESEDIEDRLRNLLLAIHVAANYTKTTGRKLPDQVEYFGTSILGRASVSDFTKTVEKSLRMAGLYIWVSASRHQTNRAI